MTDRAWRPAAPPKTARLTAVRSYGTAAFATGQRGLLSERVAPGSWRARCLNGPEAARRDLFDAAFTGDGARIWFCGEDGALGYYDRMADELTSMTAPYGHTATFRGVAVRGARGSESVHAADGRGRVLRLGADGGRCAARGAAVPGDGSALTDVVYADGVVVVADAAGRLHYSEDGRTWRSRRLAGVALRSLDWSPSLGLVAVDDAGAVYRNAAPETGRVARATPGLGSPRAVTAARERLVVAGGPPHEPRVGGSSELLALDGDRAIRRTPGAAEALYGVELLGDGTLLAVGAAGTIAEGV